MPSRDYANDVPEYEVEQRKMEALESIAESLLVIQRAVAKSTDSEGTLVVGTQPPAYY